jgi:hypothetical protein
MSTATAASLVKEVICPNCWERFAPEQVMYVSTHQDLFGDLRLGPQARRRFLPTRFHPDGRAVDAKGSPCHDLACPKCHLMVPRVFVERPTFFVSVFGSPSSGKSYALATMTHRLRWVLPSQFATDFSDADPEANSILHACEDTLFAANDPDALVALQKTAEVGDWYQRVWFGQKEILYPKPFFFQLSPVGSHPHAARAAQFGRTLCLYDNAGESFQPGADRPDNPVTQHMSKSSCIMFVFDPTQQPDFRKRLAGASNDVQVLGGVMGRQDVLLAEAARRIRAYRGLATGVRHDRPLIVVVSKFDAWRKLLNLEALPEPWSRHSSGGFSVFHTDLVQQVSDAIRRLLRELAPSIPSTAETFFDPEKIVYIPMSATGGPPERLPDGGLGHRAGSIKPIWAEVPMLYALSLYGSTGMEGGGMIPYTMRRPPNPTPAAGGPS